MRGVRWLLAAAVVLAMGTLAPAVLALDTVSGSITLSTRFPGVNVGPGNSAIFNLAVGGPEGERVNLEVTGVPDGWTSSLRGGGALIDEVVISADATSNPSLEVKVPDDAAEGDYTFTVVATGASGTARLDLHVRVTQLVSGGVTLTTDYPDLRGGPTDDFTFSLNLTNDTPQEIQFGLSGDGPTGWTIDVRPSQAARASTITLGAGESGYITVDVSPVSTAAAGQYQVVVRAEGGGQTQEETLGIEITGRYALSLSTSDQRLNFQIEAGHSTDLDLVLVNSGSAPQGAITLSASALPTGWSATFSPATVDQLDPSGYATVTATITAAGDAVAGDYAMALNATSADSSEQIELRATVQTSALWGLVGIAVIVVALGGLGVVFWRFGRR
jgi:uncharacterized membrane protein